ncbi:HypC/HybG/HupF family hydrogenase formation chaperone [Haloimpatiens sp. FM7330]|uniref:HypC/HybG/HupF family hydrogenase formation chaperone n=1 Tax=Haloimpatiens sp. FM7330 TaxID=3298610 RepID=UPI003637F72A
MCLAIPLKIIEIDKNKALGEINGFKKEIRVDIVPNVKIGDYVMVHAGFAIEIIDEKNANDIMEAVNEVNEAME